MIKRIWTCWVIWTIMALTFPVAAAADLLDQAFRETAWKILETLPVDTHVRLIAITDIREDDGRLSRYLTEALKSSRHFILIERNQLQHLIQEQGFQLSDLVNPADRIEPGGIKGVEGIVFGEVIRAYQSPLSADVRVFLQMDDVQSGKILMAREFSSTVHAPYRNGVIGAALVFFVLMVMTIWFRGRLRSWALGRQQAAWKKREAMTDDLTRFSGVLQQVRSAGCAAGLEADISAADFDIGLIRDKIAGGRWGQGIGADRRSLAKADRKIAKEIQSAHKISEKLLQACREQNAEKTALLFAQLKKQLAGISTAIEQRT